MSGTNKDAKLHLKVVFNKQRTKVLFVEADNHFTDTLLSFLTLPLGRLVRVLQQHYGDEAPVIGSMNTLYSSLSNLNSSYFWTKRCKQMLLNPVSKFSDECSRLKLDVSYSLPNRYFVCENYGCDYRKQIHLGWYHGTARCRCGKPMSREVFINEVLPENGGSFTVTNSTFLITDDFHIFSNDTASFIQLMTKLGIEEKEWGERTSVTFGLDETMELLKASLFSSTPLTDVVIKKGKCGSAAPGFETCKIEEKRNYSGHNVKAIVQRSTNRLLFVESDESFVDFLFSLFTIPLGGVEHLLGSSTPFFKNINNLHKSVADAIDVRSFEIDSCKQRLTELHLLPRGYDSNRQLLPLKTEYSDLAVYYFKGNSQGEEYVSRFGGYSYGSDKCDVDFEDRPRHEFNYFRKSGGFKITDDLTVRPMSALDALNIPISDVAEQELCIGREEGLNLLKTSLTSTSVLSKVLGPMLMKKPKQEL